MTEVVDRSPPPTDRFLAALSTLLLPRDGWGSFRRGARPAAVVTILYRRAGEWQVPFVVRRADLASHPGQVGLPGGGVHAGEDAWAAAAREAEEEIGVRADRLNPLGAAPPLYAAVTNFSVVAFVAWLAEPDPVFVAGAGEVDRVLEVRLRLLIDGDAWIDGPRPWPGRHLPFGGTVIWGLTARLLDDLLPPIQDAASSAALFA